MCVCACVRVFLSVCFVVAVVVTVVLVQFYLAHTCYVIDFPLTLTRALAADGNIPYSDFSRPSKKNGTRLGKAS